MNQITRWYTGKAKTVIETYVLPGLAEAEALGYWPKGMSRKLCAALNKQSVALKFAKANDQDYNSREENPSGKLDNVCDTRANGEWYKATVKGSDLVHCMMFGTFQRAPELVEVAEKLVPYCVNETERAALAVATQWAKDFAPVAELVARLDATRPKPVILLDTLSNTVLANVSKGMGVDFTSLECPEIIYHKVETRNEKGELVIDWEPEILWPEGTAHNTSRYAGGQSCHACGHRIFNPFNWVPLFGKTAEGHSSLWIGSDCAKNLFGCKVTGEADWSKAKAKAAQ